MNITPRILIVEDDAVLAMELQETLIHLGYQVSGLAATGKAAVESTLAQKPDIILMDIRLRGAVTGIQAVEEIHQHLDIPVVYLTAFADETLLQQAKITDAYAYLVKPVRERELRAGLEMALYKRSAEQRMQHLNQILRAVRDVNQLIAREHDARRLVMDACQILLRTHGYRFVWVGESAGYRLNPLAHAGDGQELIARIVASATPEQGMKLPGTEAARTRRVVVCHDMLQDDRYAPWRKEVEQVHFSSTVAVPILHEENLFGVLSVYSDQTNIFGAEELDLLLEVAGDIAFGLKAIARESEQKHAEIALRESEAKFRAILDNSRDSIGVHVNGIWELCNPAAVKLFGVASPEDLLGKPIFNVIAPSERARIRDFVQNRMVGADAPSGYLTRGLRADGTEFDMDVTLSSFVLEGKPHVLVILRDITEKKRAEEALRESEQKHRRLFENMSQGVIYYSASGKIISANPAAEHILGFSLDQLQGSPFVNVAWKLIREDGSTLPAEEHPIAISLQTGKPVEGVILGVFNPNTTKTIWLSITAVPLFNLKEEVPFQVYSTFEDITERKLAGEKLLKSESLFRAVVEHSHDGIVLMNPERRPFYVSPSYTQISGYSPEEWIGGYGPDFIHPKDREIAANSFRDVLQSPGKMAAAAYRLRHKKGHWFWVETNATNLLDDPVIHAVVLNSRDITERKRAEDALRENAIRYRTLLDNLPQLVWQRDLNSVFIDGNAACARTLGTTVEGLVGKTDYDFYPVDLAEKYRADDQRIIEHGVSETFDERFLKDGRERFARTTKVPLRDDLGRVCGTLGIAEDITELKGAEEDRVAREIAEQASRAKSEFISQMSHELRTPLNAILGFSQLLKMDELKPNQARGLEQIYKSGRHLLNLVNEVLDIARIESGKMAISPEPVRLADTLQEALELIRPLAEARHISINMAASVSSEVFVQADPQSLRQVLLNLLSNAVKYNREGGEIAISARLTIDGRLRLQMRDTGDGIPPEKIERLFVPFDRLGRESVEQEGTGLGLALSKGLVEAMGGHIGAESQLGVGSTFWLELKLVSERLTEAILASVDEHLSERMRAGRGLVLYVEDNLDNLKLVEAIMERLPKVRLITTMQGRQALELAMKHNPDLILLDLHLPDMPGSEVLRQLKAEQATENTPVIILSADAMPKQIAELLAGGARAYLTKPIDIQEFLKVVEGSLA